MEILKIDNITINLTEATVGTCFVKEKDKWTLMEDVGLFVKIPEDHLETFVRNIVRQVKESS